VPLNEAAHIIPVSHEGSTDETSNGLSLGALHHRAYDMCLATLNQQYQIINNDSKFNELRELGLDGVD
jgi:putative restriction endonuclease